MRFDERKLYPINIYCVTVYCACNVEKLLNITCWDSRNCRTGGAWGNGLRSIVGSNNEEAVLRAIESMSASFDVDEIL